MYELFLVFMSNLDFPLMSYKIKNSKKISQINNNALVQMVSLLLKKLVILFKFSENDLVSNSISMQ